MDWDVEIARHGSRLSPGIDIECMPTAHSFMIYRALIVDFPEAKTWKSTVSAACNVLAKAWYFYTTSTEQAQLCTNHEGNKNNPRRRWCLPNECSDKTRSSFWFSGNLIVDRKPVNTSWSTRDFTSEEPTTISVHDARFHLKHWLSLTLYISQHFLKRKSHSQKSLPSIAERYWNVHTYTTTPAKPVWPHTHNVKLRVLKALGMIINYQPDQISQPHLPMYIQLWSRKHTAWVALFFIHPWPYMCITMCVWYATEMAKVLWNKNHLTKAVQNFQNHSDKLTNTALFKFYTYTPVCINCGLIMQSTSCIQHDPSHFITHKCKFSCCL